MFIGKLTISMAIFNSYVYQRLSPMVIPILSHLSGLVQGDSQAGEARENHVGDAYNQRR